MLAAGADRLSDHHFPQPDQSVSALYAIDVEEMIRAADGCRRDDRRLRQTVPTRGRISADVPAIQLVTGSMMAMPFRGERQRPYRLPAF